MFSAQKIDIPEDTLKIRYDNEKILTSLLRVLESHDGGYSEKQFKEVLRESELDEKKLLLTLLNQWSLVALRIMEIKDRRDYMEPQIKSINGYKIFGPKALEEWVFKQGEVGGSRSSFCFQKLEQSY
jgi:hypothetical protein